MNFKQLGPYTISDQLGRGGMGTVFAGLNEDSGERVAVKVLSQSLASDEGFRERFEQEIETLRKLRHENIVRLFGFGEQDGTLFYTMELVEGSSLEQEVRKGRKFDWSEATQIGVQMCKGLKHAHDRGVIHRDIKPANLMITPEGQIKISDFGIAKLFGASGMTMAGGVIGTAEFMAPEQADGRPVSHRSDLYSLGVVLYALVAGRPPFVSKSIVDVLQMQRFSKPDPLRRHNADVPREFDDIVMQLLSKDPQERVSNAAVLMRRLESTERGLSKQIVKPEGDGDFELGTGVTPADPHVDPGATGQIELTRVATGEHKNDSVDLMGPTRQTGNSDLAATQASVVARDPESGEVAPATHYTEVDESDLGEDLLSDDEPTRNWPKIVLLATALIVILGLVWWFMQPPSANDLYAEIEQAIGQDTEDAYNRVEEKVVEFLERFPNHSDAEAVRTFQNTFAQNTNTRNLRNRLRRKPPGKLHPLERLFLSATDAQLSPTRQTEMLQTFVVLAAGIDRDEIENLPEYLEAAEYELGELSEPATEYREDAIDFIESSLGRADRFLSNGNAEDREQGKQILRGLQTLYADESWAQEYVDSATRKLAEAESNEADGNE